MTDSEVRLLLMSICLGVGIIYGIFVLIRGWGKPKELSEQEKLSKFWDSDD